MTMEMVSKPFPILDCYRQVFIITKDKFSFFVDISG